MILIGWLLKWLWLAVFGKARYSRSLQLGDWKEQECKNKNSSELQQNQYNINTLQQLPINNSFFKEHEFFVNFVLSRGDVFPSLSCKFFGALRMSIGFFFYDKFLIRIWDRHLGGLVRYQWPLFFLLHNNILCFIHLCMIRL